MSTKQVIVVRTDLNMRKGKLAAQVAHASLKVFLDRGSVIYEHWGEPAEPKLLVPLTPEMKDWVEGIFTKVVVGVGSEEKLLYLRNQAQAFLLPCALVQDVGKTEFHGVPTYTALAIGPADSEQLDKITGHLKLL